MRRRRRRRVQVVPETWTTRPITGFELYCMLMLIADVKKVEITPDGWLSLVHLIASRSEGTLDAQSIMHWPAEEIGRVGSAVWDSIPKGGTVPLDSNTSIPSPFLRAFDPGNLSL